MSAVAFEWAAADSDLLSDQVWRDDRETGPYVLPHEEGRVRTLSFETKANQRDFRNQLSSAKSEISALDEAVAEMIANDQERRRADGIFLERALLDALTNDLDGKLEHNRRQLDTVLLHRVPSSTNRIWNQLSASQNNRGRIAWQLEELADLDPTVNPTETLLIMDESLKNAFDLAHKQLKVYKQYAEQREREMTRRDRTLH